jgi:hypothetical protein
MSKVLGGLAMVAAAALTAVPALAQTTPAIYSGSIMIGFGDAANKPPFDADLGNDGVPACARTNPYLPATIATVPIIGYVEQNTGAQPRSLMFEGYTPPNNSPGAESGGGQEPIVTSTCFVLFPPFLGGQLRSRVQFGTQVWPGQKFLSQTSMGAVNLSAGVGGGTLSAGGGNVVANPITYTEQLSYPAGSGPGCSPGTPCTTMQTVMGNGTNFQPVSFYGTGGGGRNVLEPGANSFGGGVPVNNNGLVQLGVNTNFANAAGTGPLATFGLRAYAEGFLPTGPALFGTNATSTNVPVGFRGGNVYTWAFHTPGPTGTSMTIPRTANFGWSQGALQTVGGGNTGAGGPGPLLTTPGNFRGLFHKWTTGKVQHVDSSGMYVTIRSAEGFDNTSPATSTASLGTTRKLQLVTPWSASIQQALTQPWATAVATLPDFGFGGIAILNLDIRPIPEPGAAMMLGVGSTCLFGLGLIRRRNR